MTTAEGTSTLSTAQRIRTARAEAGWTQRRLAEACGVDAAEICRYEKGRQRPTSATVDKIMNALGQSHVLDAVDGALGIQGRPPGALRRVNVLGEAPPVQWVAEGFVARGAVTMIAGEPGAGKSFLSQSVATAIVEGHHEAAGFPLAWAGSAGRVLVIDAENGEALIQRRTRAMGLSEAGAANLTVLEADGFDLENDVAALDSIVADERPDLIILDSFVSLWSGSESSVDGVKRVLNRLRDIARTYNAGVLLIHHTDKAGDTYRGSGAIAGTIEAVFTFTRDDNGAPEDRLIDCKKMRLDAEPKTRRVTLTGAGVFAADTYHGTQAREE